MGFPLIFSQNQTLQLSVARIYIGVAAFEDKVICAGGLVPFQSDPQAFTPVKIIEIIDSKTRNIQKIEFPKERGGTESVVWRKKVMFYNDAFSKSLLSKGSADIYDFEKNTWQTVFFSNRYSFLSSILIDNKVYFFNGRFGSNVFMDKIEVYDFEKDSWTFIPLPDLRSYMFCYLFNKKIYLIGGVSKALQLSRKVDIFDTQLATWTSGDSLAEAKSISFLSPSPSVLVGTKAIFADGEIYDLANKKSVLKPKEIGFRYSSAIVDGDKAYFAGRENLNVAQFQPSDSIKVYDASTDLWSFIRMSQPRSEMALFKYDNQIAFAGGFAQNKASDIVDIYNSKTGKWSKILISDARAFISPIVIGNKAFLVGGNRGDYNVPLNQYPLIRIFPSPTVDILELSKLDPSVKDQLEVFPNPFNSEITFRWSRKNDVSGTLKIYNIIGQEVYNSPIENRQKIVNISHLAIGTYVAYLETLSGIFTHKIVKY